MGHIHTPRKLHSNSNVFISENIHECSQNYEEDPNCDWNESKYFYACGLSSYINCLC
jgi:hypothetical protein